MNFFTIRKYSLLIIGLLFIGLIVYFLYILNPSNDVTRIKILICLPWFAFGAYFSLKWYFFLRKRKKSC